MTPLAPIIESKGDIAILNRPKITLFCSIKCPGGLILETYDLARRFREDGVTVISGFHSPMEVECLRILLRSPHPVIWSLARCMLKVIPLELRPAVEEGRLLLISPFNDKTKHITIETAMIRNRLVAMMANAVVVAHVTLGGKMESLCHELLAAGKPIYTFDHPANTHLLTAGARSMESLGPPSTCSG